MAIVYDPGSDELHGYNGAGRSSGSTSLEAMRSLVHEATGAPPKFMPTKGPLSVTVPGAPMGWCDLHAKFGKLPLGTVLAPAVRYAREGFPVTEVIASEWELQRASGRHMSTAKMPCPSSQRLSMQRWRNVRMPPGCALPKKKSSPQPTSSMAALFR